MLQKPPIHRLFGKPPANQSKTFDAALFQSYKPQPWDDIFTEIVINHQLYDDYWRSRNITERLGEIDIPIYLGSDWENVALHLNTPFVGFEHINRQNPWRMGISVRGGLQWPWESMHLEALAWYDHWLKGHDTGIMEGPPIRYFVSDCEDQGEWRSVESWPLPSTHWTELWLDSHGQLTTRLTVNVILNIVKNLFSAHLLPPNGPRPFMASPPLGATFRVTYVHYLAGPGISRLKYLSVVLNKSGKRLWEDFGESVLVSWS